MAHTIDLLTDSAATSEVNGAVEVWRGSEITKGAALVEVVSGNTQVVLCTNKTTTGAVTTEFSGVATALQIVCTGGSFTADIEVSLDGVVFAPAVDFVSPMITSDTLLILSPIASATYKLTVLTNSGSITARLS